MTDRGAEALAALPSLAQVGLYDTKVTSGGARRLQEAIGRPGVDWRRVYWWGSSSSMEEESRACV